MRTIGRRSSFITLMLILFNSRHIACLFWREFVGRNLANMTVWDIGVSMDYLHCMWMRPPSILFHDVFTWICPQKSLAKKNNLLHEPLYCRLTGILQRAPEIPIPKELNMYKVSVLGWFSKWIITLTNKMY